jgi:hypothetical protein
MTRRALSASTSGASGAKHSVRRGPPDGELLSSAVAAWPVRTGHARYVPIPRPLPFTEVLYEARRPCLSQGLQGHCNVGDRSWGQAERCSSDVCTPLRQQKAIRWPFLRDAAGKLGVTGSSPVPFHFGKAAKPVARPRGRQGVRRVREQLRPAGAADRLARPALLAANSPRAGGGMGALPDTAAQASPGTGRTSSPSRPRSNSPGSNGAPPTS